MRTRYPAASAGVGSAFFENGRGVHGPCTHACKNFGDFLQRKRLSTCPAAHGLSRGQPRVVVPATDALEFRFRQPAQH